MLDTWMEDDGLKMENEWKGERMKGRSEGGRREKENRRGGR